jgi:hypothetical protein
MDARFLCDKDAVLGGHIKERPVIPLFDKFQHMLKTKKRNEYVFMYV